MNDINQLDPNIRHFESSNIFKTNTLKFIRPKPNSIFDYYNPKGIKLITKMRLDLSHLREYKLKQFQHCLNPICTCGYEIERTTRYILHYSIYANKRILDKFGNTNISTSFYTIITKYLLFGNIFLERFDASIFAQ